MARLSGPRWHLLTPRHHNFFFSARTVCALLKRRGFDVIYAGHPGAAYSLSYLAHKGRTVLDSGATRAVANALERSTLGRVAVPVNLGDIVTIVAGRRVVQQRSRVLEGERRAPPRTGSIKEVSGDGAVSAQLAPQDE